MKKDTENKTRYLKDQIIINLSVTFLRTHMHKSKCSLNKVCLVWFLKLILRVRQPESLNSLWTSKNYDLCLLGCA